MCAAAACAAARRLAASSAAARSSWPHRPSPGLAGLARWVLSSRLPTHVAVPTPWSLHRGAAAASTSAAAEPGPALPPPSPWAPPAPSETPEAAAAPSPSGRTHPLDYTTLAALAAALRGLAVPAKVDEVMQADAFTVCLRVRAEACRPEGGGGAEVASPSPAVATTAADVGNAGADFDGDAGAPHLETLWVWVCWHPAGTRVTVGPPPERGGPAEAYGFGRSLHAALAGTVLKAVRTPVPFERCVELLFAPAASDPATKALALHGRAGDCGLALVDVAQRGGRPAPGAKKRDGKKAAKPMSEAALREQRKAGPPRPAQVTYGTCLAASVAPSSLRQAGRASRMAPGGSYRLPQPDGRQLVPCPSETVGLWRANVVAAAADADVAEAKHAAGSGGEGGDAPAPPDADAAATAAPTRPPRRKPDPGIAACLARVYAGVGRAVADEMCAVAGLDPAARPADLSEGDWARLHEAWTRWLCTLSAATFEVGPGVYGRPFSVLGQSGAALRGGPLAERDPFALAASAGAETAARGGLGAPLPAMEPGPARDLLDRVDAYFRAAKAARAPASLERHVIRGADKALRRARDKVASLAAAADRATQADAKSHAADLLMANVHAIPGGASQATVTDWETGDDVVIPLGDGRTPAVDVAAAMYKEARRLRRGEEAVGPLLEAARTDVAEAEALAERLAALPGGGEAGGEGDEDASAAADRRAVLQEVRRALEAKGWLAPWREAGLEAMGAAAGRRAAKREGGGGGGPDGAPTFRRFTSPSGLAVLVGRSNRENDTLSLRVAAADDIWLHARGVPGAHVVLRAPAGKEADGGPSEEDIRFAAGLAAFFSKARDGGSVDVSHTLARNVKKPRGAPAGLVTLLAESVVRVRPDDVAGVVADASGSGGEEG